MRLHSDLIFKAISLVVPTLVMIKLHVYNLTGIALIYFPYIIVFLLSNKNQRKNKLLLVSNLVVLVVLTLISFELLNVSKYNDFQVNTNSFLLVIMQPFIAWTYFVIYYNVGTIRDFRHKKLN